MAETEQKRTVSKVAEGWWDYTTLDEQVLNDAATLSADDLVGLSRDGFEVRIIDTVEEFYLAEALEYIRVWQTATADTPTGICGPIGPTEQLPLVARIVNDLEIDIRDGHFWAMDEWVEDGVSVGIDHPLSFAKADLDLCFNRISPKLRMPDNHLHFLTSDSIEDYRASYDQADCLVMQGGQGEVKHWAFNDPFKRVGAYADAPPSPEEYRNLPTRLVDLHPMTIIQNARTSGGGVVSAVPTQALTVGPIETWKSKQVSIWQAGMHDNPFGMRLTTLMISKRIADSSVPMSLLADHPDVKFTFLRDGIGTCDAQMH